MKWNHQISGNNFGEIAQYTFDLASEKPGKYLSSPSFLGYKDVAVEIVCVGATGMVVANATIWESNSRGGSDQLYATGAVVGVGVNTSNLDKVTDFMGEYVIIEFPTLVSVGQMTVRITGKA